LKNKIYDFAVADQHLAKKCILVSQVKYQTNRLIVFVNFFFFSKASGVSNKVRFVIMVCFDHRSCGSSQDS